MSPIKYIMYQVRYCWRWFKLANWECFSETDILSNVNFRFKLFQISLFFVIIIIVIIGVWSLITKEENSTKSLLVP